jgi:1-acyl-sn-glycerol-3-phosphate acyltransferase
MLDSAGMLLPNHVSWLDIVVINAHWPARFVAKEEVRHWPIIGWLASCAGTLFIRRGIRSDVALLGRDLVDLLQKGQTVALFAEGTTSDGSGVLPFRSALLQAAVVTGTTVQPLALRYEMDDGALDSTPVYTGTTSFAESLWRIAGRSRIHVRVTAGAPLHAGTDRRLLAGAAHGEVERMLQQVARRYEPMAFPSEVTIQVRT